MSNNDIVPGFDTFSVDSIRIQLNRIDYIPQCLVLTVLGYVDISNCHSFQKRVALAIESGFLKLIFSLKGYNEVSSCGLGSFTAFLKAVKPRGGNVVFIEVQDKVLQIWNKLDFGKYLIIKKSLGEGIRFFLLAAEKEKSDIKCVNCENELLLIYDGRFYCEKCKAIVKIENSRQYFAWLNMLA